MEARKQGLVKHTGGCHCGAVRFEVLAPAKLHIYDCNCSICRKKQNIVFIVPKPRFTLLKGKDHLTLYQFNTKQAKHMFCKICGVQPYYQPRSNPDGYGVTRHCLDSGSVESVDLELVDGDHWEQWMAEQKAKTVSILDDSKE